MPDLETTLHVDMLRRFRSNRTLFRRVLRAVRKEIAAPPVYGLEWGDPETVEPLRFVRDRYVLPYVRPEHSALEIGPGGGRWTRYLVPFRTLYVVDYYAQLLEELKRSFRRRTPSSSATTAPISPVLRRARWTFCFRLARSFTWTFL